MASSVLPIAVLLALCAITPTTSSKIVDQPPRIANISTTSKNETTKLSALSNATEEMFGDQPLVPFYPRPGNTSSGQVYVHRYTIRTLTPGKEYVLSAVPYEQPAHLVTSPQNYIGQKPDFSMDFPAVSGYPWCGYPYHCMQGSVCPTRECPEGAFCCRSVMGICCHYSNTEDRVLDSDSAASSRGSYGKEAADLYPAGNASVNFYPDPPPALYPQPDQVVELYPGESLGASYPVYDSLPIDEAEDAYDLAERPTMPQSVPGSASAYDIGLEHPEYPGRPILPVSISAERYTPPSYRHSPQIHRPVYPHSRPAAEDISSYSSPSQALPQPSGPKHIIHPVFGSIVVDVEDTSSSFQPKVKYDVPDYGFEEPREYETRIPIEPLKPQHGMSDYEIAAPRPQHGTPEYEFVVPMQPKPQPGLPDYEITAPMPQYGTPDYEFTARIQPQHARPDYETISPMRPPKPQYGTPENEFTAPIQPQHARPDYETIYPVQPTKPRNGTPDYAFLAPSKPLAPYAPGGTVGKPVMTHSSYPKTDFHPVYHRPSVNAVLHSYAEPKAPAVQTVLQKYASPAPGALPSMQALLQNNSGTPIDLPYLQPYEGAPSIRAVIKPPSEPTSVREVLGSSRFVPSYRVGSQATTNYVRPAPSTGNQHPLYPNVYAPYPQAPYPQAPYPPPRRPVQPYSGGSPPGLVDAYSALQTYRPTLQAYAPLQHHLYPFQPYPQPFGPSAGSFGYSPYSQNYVPTGYRVLKETYPGGAILPKYTPGSPNSPRVPLAMRPISPTYVVPLADTPIPLSPKHQYPRSHYQHRIPYSNLQHLYNPSRAAPVYERRNRG